MSTLIYPEHYTALLDVHKTEQGIKLIKDFFQQNLATELHLRRVTAPLFVLKGLGINDDLNGVVPHQRPRRREGGGGAFARKMEASDSCRLRHRAGIGHIYGHERHPCRRRAGQSALALRRPMGLGSCHPQGGPHACFPARRGEEDICCHKTNRVSRLRDLRQHKAFPS